MEIIDTFRFSESEGRKMRRGAFLPLLLIVPLATLFAIDSSKSQPAHFLMTFGMGILFGTLVVMISLAGVRNRIEHMTRTSLSVIDGKLLWSSGAGQTELPLPAVTTLTIHERGKSVRSITLSFGDRGPVTLEGLERMNELAACLERQVDAQKVARRKWYHF